MKLYSLEAVDQLIARYIEKGGEVITTREGALLDDYVLQGEGLKTIVIQSKFLNSWSSAYAIRKYNKTPEKYIRLIENILCTN